MIILTADDFALSDGVSRAIAELCRERRLSAISALVTGKDWCEQARYLDELHATTAVGLHFNLTLGHPRLAQNGAAHLGGDGAFLPLGRLIRGALLRQLDGGAVEAECRAQIEVFEAATGTLPDFIDGHQHVHALPVVRDGVIAAIRKRHWPRPPLVRVPRSPATLRQKGNGARLKQGVVNWLSSGFASALRAAGLPSNDTFAGFSTFTVGSDYARELEAALAVDRPRCHLVMCHPGRDDAALAQSGDPLVARREEEYDVLMRIVDLPARIWHATREDDGGIDWLKAIGP